MRFLLSMLAYAWIFAGTASATVSVNLSGSAENSSAALVKSNDHSISANVGLNLGQHFMVGITHRRSYEDKTGLRRDFVANSLLYLPFEDRTETVTNSIDLTIIPFNAVVSPFIFGGVARRDYHNSYEYMGQRTRSTIIQFPIPNYGGGVAVQLGMGFQLRLTHTFTPGIESEIIDGEEKRKDVLDTYSQIWLGYKL